MSESRHLQYIKKLRRKKRLIFLIQVSICILFLIAWELAAKLCVIDIFIYSSPSRILKTTISMLKDGSLLYHMGVTLSETIFSFLLITILGILFATLLWLIPFLSDVLQPYLVILNSLPKSALAPLLIVWQGNNMRTIIVAAVSVAVFGTILNLYTSFSGVDKEKITLIYTLGGNRLDVLTRVILPGNIPVILSSMKVNIGLSLVGVIIGEFLAANAGLGYLIIYGSQVFQLDMVIMSIVLLCIFAMLFYRLIGLLEKHYN